MSGTLTSPRRRTGIVGNLRLYAFIVGLVTALLGMVVAASVGATASVVLSMLALGLTLMLVSATVRRSTFALGSRWKRFMLSVYLFGATCVSLVWTGALGNGSTVWTALWAGLAVSLATLATCMFRSRRKQVHRITTLN